MPPSQIVSRLAYQGRYIGSESSFYRVLHAANQQYRRGRSQLTSARSGLTDLTSIPPRR